MAVNSQILPIGALLAGQYVIVNYLGSGSFGITYHARHQLLGREVAIKEFFPQGSLRTGSGVTAPASLGHAGYRAELRNFLAEASNLEQFRRPDIVRVDDVFEDNGTAYMVMEYITG